MDQEGTSLRARFVESLMSYDVIHRSQSVRSGGDA